MMGGDKVADSYSDFYDGSWDMPSDAYYQSGDEMTYGTVWTGSYSNGTRNIPHVASNFFSGVRVGSIIRAGERIHSGHMDREQLKRLYAISPVLTVAC